MDSLMQRRFALMAATPNLYTGGNLTFDNMYKLMLNLPAGIYYFSAAAISTDTDSSICCIRFMTADDSSSATETETQGVINRSTAGESHGMTYHCTTETDHIYLYASRNWPLGQGDTATYRNIHIERIG